VARATPLQDYRHSAAWPMESSLLFHAASLARHKRACVGGEVPPMAGRPGGEAGKSGAAGIRRHLRQEAPHA